MSLKPWNVLGFRVDDRWLWLGFGVFAFGASKGIAYGLRRMIELNTVHDIDEATAPAVPKPEDAIELETLQRLTESPNNEISISATILLLKRFSESSSDSEAWVDDFFSPSPAARQSAAQLHQLSWHYPQGRGATIDVLHDLTTFLSLMSSPESLQARTIRAAYACARTHARQGDDRPMKALRSLSRDMEHDNVKQRIVICPSMKPGQFVPWVRAMRALMRFGESNRKHTQLARALRDLHDAASLEDLEIAWPVRQDDGLCDEVDLTVELDGPQFSPPCIELELPLDARGRPARFHEESPEETEVRRRRREAMVFHEGTGEIDHNDIFTSAT